MTRAGVMKIQVPEFVVFELPDREGSWDSPFTVCFRHAVVAALEGERVNTRLSDGPGWCEECTAERKPEA